MDDEVYGADDNEIARQLKQRRHKSNPYKGERVKVEVEHGVYLLTTAEAAKALNRTVQTLRLWSCKGNGPIHPVNVGGRLGWNPKDIEAVLNGDVL